MIRASLVARSQLRMFRNVANVRDCTKLHCKIPAMVPSHTCYKSFGASGGDKPKNTPPGFNTSDVSGFSEPASPALKPMQSTILGSGRSFGKDEEGNTLKGLASTDEKAPNVFGAVVTGSGKIDGSEPLEETTLRSKPCHESGSGAGAGSGSSKDGDKSDAQKKASAAKDAAAKQLSEIVANLPSKQQTEKYFFRVVAFLYDLTYLTGTWVLHFVEQNIIRNQSVQHYWKRFHEKMEQAKKD